jgi:N-acetylglucosamine malate deacetylase 2
VPAAASAPQSASHTDMSDWRTELTGRVLVLVAHADDEYVAYGALLQKMREPMLVIATDGAPRDEYFWGRYGSREAYAAVRRKEARRAAQVVGICPCTLTASAPAPVRNLVLLAEQDPRLEDQRLFLNLAPAFEMLCKVAGQVRPEAIATLAYEGGHPDHDSCSLLAARLGERLHVPVWEAPGYARFEDCKSPSGESSQSGSDGHAAAAAGAMAGELRVQQFLHENGTEAQVEITKEELERKRAMCAEYASQGEILRGFDARREVVRPQLRYDYARRPHAGPVNYECWQWWMKADEVSACFEEFLEKGP